MFQTTKQIPCCEFVMYFKSEHTSHLINWTFPNFPSLCVTLCIASLTSVNLSGTSTNSTKLLYCKMTPEHSAGVQETTFHLGESVHCWTKTVEYHKETVPNQRYCVGEKYCIYTVSMEKFPHNSPWFPWGWMCFVQRKTTANLSFRALGWLKS